MKKSVVTFTSVVSSLCIISSVAYASIELHASRPPRIRQAHYDVAEKTLVHKNHAHVLASKKRFTVQAAPATQMAETEHDDDFGDLFAQAAPAPVTSAAQAAPASRRALASRDHVITTASHRHRVTTVAHVHRVSHRPAAPAAH